MNLGTVGMVDTYSEREYIPREWDANFTLVLSLCRVLSSRCL